MKGLVVLLLVLTGLSGYCQIDPDKLIAIKESSRWTKAGQTIRKAISKDSLDPEPPYLMAIYFLQPNHPNYHVDSSSRYQKQAARLYKRKTKGKNDVPDSLALLRLRKSIDSAAFQRARKIGTEESYQFFLLNYPLAAQVPMAAEARNEQAFLKAAKVNTAKGYRAYAERFPRSLRAPEARKRMETLEFEEATKDKRLASYRKFYKEFPDNPNRPLAEKRIFEMMTAPGSPAALLRFLNAYPESRAANQVRVLLFSLQREGEAVPEGKWKTDSLKKEREPEGYWIPVYKGGKYGFINEKGKEVISPRFEDIPEGYRCGEITDRFIVTSRGLLARNGQLVWKGKLKDFDDLGVGFLYVATDSGGFVVHESGFRMNSKPADDALVIANRFVGINQADKWSVYSLTGTPLMMKAFDDIEVLDSVVQLTKNKKRILTIPSRISAVAEGGEFKEDIVFDEVRKWGDRQYWVRNGVMEGVIDTNLKFIIALDRQALRKTPFGFVSTRAGNQYVKGVRVLDGKGYKQVVELGGWIRLKDAGGRHWLCERSTGTLTEGDSAWFKGKLAFLLDGDSIRVFMPSGQPLSFARNAPFVLKESKDSSAFMIVQERKLKAVYDAVSGVRLFAAEFEDVEPMTASLFQVTKLGKKGLLRADGKVALPPEYDAIVSAGETSFSLLKEKKFGWYDYKTNLLVKPVYDRNVKPYSSRLWIAFKDNGYWFLSADGKPYGPNQWDEVSHWTDSVAWVKKGGAWKLLDLISQKVKVDNVRQFTYIRESGNKLAIVQQDKVYGVLSSRKGTIVPFQYTDVVNLGTRETPLYFTERHISEAGLTVVVYFDQYGKSVRSQAMEGDELDKITCEN